MVSVGVSKGDQCTNEDKCGALIYLQLEVGETDEAITEKLKRSLH